MDAKMTSATCEQGRFESEDYHYLVDSLDPLFSSCECLVALLASWAMTWAMALTNGTDALGRRSLTTSTSTYNFG